MELSYGSRLFGILIYLFVFFTMRKSILFHRKVLFSVVLFWWTIVGTALGEGVDSQIVNDLKAAQQTINEKVSPFCYHNGHSLTKSSYLSGKFSEYTKNHQTLVYPFCITTHELGNRLGNYVQEVACAEASGLHFVSVHSNWEHSNAITSNSSHLVTQKNNHTAAAIAFFKGFPDIIVHPNPLDKTHASAKIQHECKCTRYCWGHGNAVWVNRTSNIRKYIQQAVQSYLHTIDSSASASIDPTQDVTNAKPGEHLPLIPDVAMQYRCGDNIGFSYMYGILPFTVIDDRIPMDAKYIYVLSDHPSRAAHSPYSSRCKLILEKLFEYIKQRRPNATILVKRGGDLFLDFARFATAKTTICSASTYCFWPALSSPNKVYFPITSLIAGADSPELAPDFGSHFNWIASPPIISHMKGLRPWTQIIDVLEGKMELPGK
jgi:hypothetical protein